MPFIGLGIGVSAIDADGGNMDEDIDGFNTKIDTSANTLLLGLTIHI